MDALLVSLWFLTQCPRSVPLLIKIRTANASCDDWEKLITSLTASDRLLHVVACVAKGAGDVTDERWLSSLLQQIDVEGLSQLSCWLSGVLSVEGSRSSRTITVARDQSAALDLARDSYENLGKIRSYFLFFSFLYF